jgi:endothelin-converting enzyme/putative endopeptidase
MTFSHELGHGFDDFGRNFDGIGDQNPWLSPSATAAFDARAQCLVEQYSAFTVAGVADPSTGVNPAHVDGKNTLTENIADNVAVKVAFRATGSEAKTGPLVAGLTPPQQFFVGHAQAYCSKLTPDQARDQLSFETHAPPKARVNIPASNFDGFQRAFSCEAGAPMAPKERCSIW